MESDPIEIRRVQGAHLQPYIEDLARLRIEVFREYPYLYDGDMGYERRYIERYATSPDSVFVLAIDDGQVVGVATGQPLEHEVASLQQPFRDHQWPIASIFYFGESVLQRSHRGRGIGVQFIAQREAHARSFGDRFEYVAFCAVNRAVDHPLRPKNYVPLDAFWRKRGFRREAELQGSLIWKDLNEDVESPKTLTFWIKSLGAD